MSISSMISNFKKLNFCNFPPYFPLLVRPCVFPIQMASSHTASPIKIPCISPIHLLFQGGSFAVTFPPVISPHYPRFLPLSECPTGRIYTKSQTIMFKIEAFPWGIITCTEQEEGAFQGDFRACLKSLDKREGKADNKGKQAGDEGECVNIQAISAGKSMRRYERI